MKNLFESKLSTELEGQDRKKSPADMYPSLVCVALSIWANLVDSASGTSFLNENYLINVFSH